MGVFVGVDVGSMTTKVVVLTDEIEVIFQEYIPNDGGPIDAIRKVFTEMLKALGEDLTVDAAGATGSGRHLASVIIGADMVKNEITAHAAAARFVEPNARTVIDIGGQDSKIIFLKHGVSIGFNMNTVCAAGTGSFLDHQAHRLGIPIEKFGEYALRSTAPVRIAGRCGVFAESDLIHKQQMGYKKEDLIAGLCTALVTNYVTNVARGKRIEPPVLFQGGVAANVGIRAALEKEIGVKVVIPKHFKVMGALGAALLSREAYHMTPVKSGFKGVKRIASFSCVPRGFICGGCANSCEISEIYIDGQIAARWGSRCRKWEDLRREPNLEAVSNS